MKKVIILIFMILSLFLYFNSKKEIKIPDSAIRFRVLANSNSPKDQKIKEEVRNKLQKELYLILENTKTIESARDKISKNMNYFKKILEDETKDKDYSYSIDYGMHEFPKKVYRGVTYEEGYYESLLVTLGEGKGDNWWCVLFPPLCVLEAEEEYTEEITYKSLIKEIIQKYF